MALPSVKKYKGRKRYRIADGPGHDGFKVHFLGPETHRDQRGVVFTIDGVRMLAQVLAVMDVPYQERDINAGEQHHNVFYLWIKVLRNANHPEIKPSHVLEGRFRTDKRAGFFQAATSAH